MPARSTVDSGMASVRSTKSSRSSASTRSPSLAEASLANRISTDCTTTKPTIASVTWSTVVVVVPCWTAWTSWPSSHGMARPATAASACRPSATTQLARVPAHQGPRVPAYLGRRRRPAAGRSLVLPAGHAGGVCAPTCRAVPGGCPRPPPGRARHRPRDRPGRARAGWCVQTTVVRPAGRRARRAAMRASVCASTALVGSTSTSTGGSASSARVSRSRCCWPPENSRPRSATVVSSPSGSAVDDVLGAGRVQRRPDPLGLGDARSGQLVAQPAGEEPGVVVGHQDELADRRAGRSRSGTPSRRAGLSV